MEANRERLAIFNPATKCLDDVRFVTINGGAVQLTLEEEPKIGGDLMVGAGNATQGARDLIAEAENALSDFKKDEPEIDLDDAIEYGLAELEQDTMGVASRIGDEAWTWYHAVKSEVERLMEGGAK